MLNDEYFYGIIYEFNLFIANHLFSFYSFLLFHIWHLDKLLICSFQKRKNNIHALFFFSISLDSKYFFVFCCNILTLLWRFHKVHHCLSLLFLLLSFASLLILFLHLNKKEAHILSMLNGMKQNETTNKLIIQFIILDRFIWSALLIN